MIAAYKRIGFFGKVIIPILVILPLSILLNTIYLQNSAEKSVVESSVLFAKATIEQFKILRSYYTENIVSKVKTQGAMQIGIDHKDAANTIPLPATMIHDLSEKFSKAESGLKLKLYSEFPFPNRKDRVLDDFAKEAIAFLKANPEKVYSKVSLVSEKEVVRVAIADKMVAQSCVGCHNSHAQSPFKSWKVGDVRGVLEVEVPIQKQIAANAAMVKSSGGFNIGVAGLLLVVIGFTLFFYIAKPVKFMVQTLNKSVENTFEQSSSLASASSEVSSACVEQASAIQETVATLDQIRAMSAKSVDGARSSIGMSKSSHSIALEGKKSVGEMIYAIGEIDQSNKAMMKHIDESNRRIAEIVDVISQIRTKTKVIFDIVFQTRLLSFNASVEAARAGEHGKGFSVVAEEVGSLAQMSGNAAKEISDMLEESIQRVQRIVEETKSQVEASVRAGSGKVDAGNVIARRCGDILDQVVSNVVEVDKMMSEICNAAEEQARGVQGIAQSMGQLDQATHLNATSAEQTSAVSKQLLDHADELHDLVKEFEAQALGASKVAPKEAA